MDALIRETHAAERRHFWYRGFRSFVRPFLAAAVRGGRPRRLLDAGCGTGANLGLLAELGVACGIDLTLSGLRLGRKRGARRVACATACRMPFVAAVFDVVTSFDVLYCLEDAEERAAIAEMFRVLRPGGGAVVSVPAFEALRGEHSVFVHERRRYTRAGLRAALERAGFRIERLTARNALALLPLLAGRSCSPPRTARRPPRRARFRQPPAIVTPARALLRAEARLVRLVDLPFGSTVVCLARKPRPEPPGDAA